MPRRKPNLWRQISTETIFEFMGEHHEEDGTPFAVMRDNSEGPPFALRKIDPLELMKKNGDWEKVAS